jgi:hypothetical protein
MKIIISFIISLILSNSLFSKKLSDAQYLRYFKYLFLTHDWSSVGHRESDNTKKVHPVKIFLHGDWSSKNRSAFEESAYEFQKLTDLNHSFVKYHEQSNLCVTNNFAFAESMLNNYNGWWISSNHFSENSLMSYRVLIDIRRCDNKINKTLIYVNPNLFKKDYLATRLANIALARNIGFSGSSREFTSRFPLSIFSGIVDIDDGKNLSELDKSFVKLLYQQDITPSNKILPFKMNRTLVFKAIRHYNLLDRVR